MFFTARAPCVWKEVTPVVIALYLNRFEPRLSYQRK